MRSVTFCEVNILRRLDSTLKTPNFHSPLQPLNLSSTHFTRRLPAIQRTIPKVPVASNLFPAQQLSQLYFRRRLITGREKNIMAVRTNTDNSPFSFSMPGNRKNSAAQPQISQEASWNTEGSSPTSSSPPASSTLIDSHQPSSTTQLSKSPTTDDPMSDMSHIPMHSQGTNNREEGLERWKYEMTMRFLHGQDSDFSYKEVDENEEFDELEIREEQDKWFEDEEPEWSSDVASREVVAGETGIQDF